MKPDELSQALAALGYSQRGFAGYIHTNERTVRRWVRGEQDIPPWVAVMLALLRQVRAAGGVPAGPLETGGA